MLKLNLFLLWGPFFPPFEVISAKFRRFSRSHTFWSPGSSAGKESACNAGNPRLIPELGRSPGEGIGYPFPGFFPGEPAWTGEPGGLQTMGSQKTQLSTAHIGLGKIKCMIIVCEKINSRTGWSREQVLELDSVQFSSTAQSCLTLCDPMNRSMPDRPIHHQLPESTQTHVH